MMIWRGNNIILLGIIIMKIIKIINIIYNNIYEVIDLKVFVRNFNCESRACYVGNFRESFFLICENKILFRKNFAKIGYYNY